MAKVVTKAGGETEEFAERKVFDSVVRAGADEATAERISVETGKKIGESATSEDIYRMVRGELAETDRVAAAKYSLKKAMMRMGPTGFPFEKYVAMLLREYGFETEVGRLTPGKCVVHEVDVWANKGGTRRMVECKYHNEPGSRSDLKVALYVFARYLDIREASNASPPPSPPQRGGENIAESSPPLPPPRRGGGLTIEPWLVTNTKVTSAAAQYAKCSGLQVLAWRYPRRMSLEDMIKEKKLYPATIFSAINQAAWNNLQETGLVLAKDLAKLPAGELAEITGLKEKMAERVVEDAGKL